MHPDEVRARPKPPQRPVARRSALRAALEQSMLQISVGAVIIGALGWSWLIYSEIRSPVLVAPAVAAIDPAATNSEPSSIKAAGTSAYMRIDRAPAAAPPDQASGGESASSIVAREFSLLDPRRLADSGGRAAARQAAREAKLSKEAALTKEAALSKEAPAVKGATQAKEPKVARESTTAKEPKVAREVAAKEPRAARELTKEPAVAREASVAREQTVEREASVANEQSAAQESTIIAEPAVVKETVAAKETARSLVHLAALETVAPQFPALQTPRDPGPSHIPSIGARTSLVDFETAPFPYHGAVPGSNRPFLSAGEEGRRGHVNFRGRVFWESPTFSDDRVLLHIPPGFDPKRPAVMVVFFHGHGANLARDVRDRQQVPAQITAAGTNAVLVAPQFAVNAADSSAGKFWEPNGFKRFLDEAAVKLANLYGDQRSASTFANMPIVIVAYSGGFGPTLSVLDHGGVRSRVRGLVLLDALYGGFDKFADWIANNRSTFFVSSYTPHTAGHNTYLEHLLRERGVSYDSELRRNHLRGMVAFLPAGPISHRDFVNHAWSDFPIKDVLVRMDDVGPQYAHADATASIPGPASTDRRD